MFKPIIRFFAFFAKELHHIRRQPGLIVSLILGPVLILLVFGLGYSPNPPDYKVSVVWPPTIDENAEGVGLLRENLDVYFNVINYYESEEQATQQFLTGRTEAVALLMIPENVASVMETGNQVNVRILLNEIDPQQERFIQHAFEQFFDDINEVLLEDSIERFQAESGETQSEVERVNQDLQQLNTALADQEVDDARESIGSLNSSLDTLSSVGVLGVYMESEDGSKTNQVEQIQTDLEELDQILATGEIEENQQKIDEVQNRLTTLEERLSQIERVPPNAIVAPLRQSVENAFEEPYDLQVFFSPRVLALVLQHIAITLGALTLVRETSQGTLEYFGVAPTSGMQTLLGKYFAYFVTLAVITALLIVSMIYILEVPQMGSWGTFIGFIALYLFSNLSIGFLISVLSNTESQAIQASMLFLLVSIFFSGFILPLQNFRNVVGQLGNVLPITHANIAFADMLLIGRSPTLFAWIAVTVLGIVTFAATSILWNMRYRNLS